MNAPTNNRPKSTNKPKTDKPLPPIKLYVLAPEGTNMDQVHLVRKQKDITPILLANRTLGVKEFVFPREKRDSGDAA